MRRTLQGIAVPAALVALIAFTFWSLGDAEFISLDDWGYVVKNPFIERGITREAVWWAFSETREANWHPLTWLSHMLDVQLFGLEPRGHHLTSLLLHIANSTLLYLVLRAMTGARWRSAGAAALFAVHPLHVESVAWVAERKDVLSAFFWIAAMGAYARYVRRPSVPRYLAVFAALAFGLLCKAMPVTLPFALLLLDYWPLGRIAGAGPGRTGTARWVPVLAEKMPLLALSAAASAVVYLVQKSGGAFGLLMHLPLWKRALNAALSYGVYFLKFFVPSPLAVYYSYQLDVPWWRPTAAAGLLAVTTLLALWAGRTKGYVPVGWFWFLGTLVPVIGLVQVGGQAGADRYTYLPLIGLALVACWGAADLAGPRRRRAAVTLAGVASLALLVALTKMQVGYWQNDISLYRHALGVSPTSFLMQSNLAYAFEVRGREAEALEAYARSLALKPGNASTYNNIGALLARRRQHREALEYFMAAIARQPDYYEAWVNLARVCEKLGLRQEAETNYRQAVRLRPADPVARERLERLLREGAVAETPAPP